jgi:hypothetical protein
MGNDMTDSVKLAGIGGDTSIHIDVRIDENGDLLFSGQDIGNAPEEVFGDLDYEYWLTVPASESPTSSSAHAFWQSCVNSA